MDLPERHTNAAMLFTNSHPTSHPPFRERRVLKSHKSFPGVEVEGMSADLFGKVRAQGAMPLEESQQAAWWALHWKWVIKLGGCAWPICKNAMDTTRTNACGGVTLQGNCQKVEDILYVIIIVGWFDSQLKFWLSFSFCFSRSNNCNWWWDDDKSFFLTIYVYMVHTHPTKFHWFPLQNVKRLHRRARQNVD